MYSHAQPSSPSWNNPVSEREGHHHTSIGDDLRRLVRVALLCLGAGSTVKLGQVLLPTSVCAAEEEVRSTNSSTHSLRAALDKSLGRPITNAEFNAFEQKIVTLSRTHEGNSRNVSGAVYRILGGIPLSSPVLDKLRLQLLLDAPKNTFEWTDLAPGIAQATTPEIKAALYHAFIRGSESDKLKVAYVLAIMGEPAALEWGLRKLQTGSDNDAANLNGDDRREREETRRLYLKIVLFPLRSLPKGDQNSESILAALVDRLKSEDEQHARASIEILQYLDPSIVQLPLPDLLLSNNPEVANLGLDRLKYDLSEDSYSFNASSPDDHSKQHEEGINIGVVRALLYNIVNSSSGYSPAAEIGCLSNIWNRVKSPQVSPPLSREDIISSVRQMGVQSDLLAGIDRVPIKALPMYAEILGQTGDEVFLNSLNGSLATDDTTNVALRTKALAFLTLQRAGRDPGHSMEFFQVMSALSVDPKDCDSCEHTGGGTVLFRSVRDALLSSQVKIPPEELVTGLTDPDPKVRELSLAGLVGMAPPNLSKIAIAAVLDEHESLAVRKIAVLALKRHYGDDQEMALAQAIYQTAGKLSQDAIANQDASIDHYTRFGNLCADAVGANFKDQRHRDVFLKMIPNVNFPPSVHSKAEQAEIIRQQRLIDALRQFGARALVRPIDDYERKVLQSSALVAYGAPDIIGKEGTITIAPRPREHAIPLCGDGFEWPKPQEMANWALQQSEETMAVDTTLANEYRDKWISRLDPDMVPFRFGWLETKASDALTSLIARYKYGQDPKVDATLKTIWIEASRKDDFFPLERLASYFKGSSDIEVIRAGAEFLRRPWSGGRKLEINWRENYLGCILNMSAEPNTDARAIIEDALLFILRDEPADGSDLWSAARRLKDYHNPSLNERVLKQFLGESRATRWRTGLYLEALGLYQ